MDVNAKPKVKLEAGERGNRQQQQCRKISRGRWITLKVVDRTQKTTNVTRMFVVSDECGDVGFAKIR